MGTEPDLEFNYIFGFEYGFEFLGKDGFGLGSGMYGIVYIECKVHVCK